MGAICRCLNISETVYYASDWFIVIFFYNEPQNCNILKKNTYIDIIF